jgi:hypothetical protein
METDIVQLRPGLSKITDGFLLHSKTAVHNPAFSYKALSSMASHLEEEGWSLMLTGVYWAEKPQVIIEYSFKSSIRIYRTCRSYRLAHFGSSSYFQFQPYLKYGG